MIALLGLIACGSPTVGAEERPVATNPLLAIRKLARISFDGTVAERVAAGSYAYLRLDDGRWVVGLDHGHAAGDPVSVLPIGLAHDFESARTGRTFDTLLFGVVSDRDLASPAVAAE